MLLSGTQQIFEQNRRCRAIARPDVFDVTFVVELFGMMIDDEIDFFRRIRQMRRLKIHDCNPIEILNRCPSSPSRFRFRAV